MESADQPVHRERGDALLLRHCGLHAGALHVRAPARERLEVELGSELAGRLLGALSGAHPMRTARLVA